MTQGSRRSGVGWPMGWRLSGDYLKEGEERAEEGAVILLAIGETARRGERDGLVVDVGEGAILAERAKDVHREDREDAHEDD